MGAIIKSAPVSSETRRIPNGSRDVAFYGKYEMATVNNAIDAEILLLQRRIEFAERDADMNEGKKQLYPVASSYRMTTICHINECRGIAKQAREEIDFLGWIKELLATAIGKEDE